jgi:hypothetical protein
MLTAQNVPVGCEQQDPGEFLPLLVMLVLALSAGCLVLKGYMLHQATAAGAS